MARPSPVPLTLIDKLVLSAEAIMKISSPALVNFNFPQWPELFPFTLDLIFLYCYILIQALKNLKEF